MAISDRTGKKCLNKTRFLLGRYCWHHTPKAVPILVSLVSVAGSLALRQLWGEVFKSAESQLIVSSGKQVESRVENVATLAEPIAFLHVVLGFREAVVAAPDQEWSIVVRLQNVRHQLRRIRVRASVRTARQANGDYTWGFAFQSLADLESRTDPLRISSGEAGYAMGTIEKTLSALPIPISVRTIGIEPFLTIRDLNECSVDVFVPPHLATAIDKVDVVANSSFRFQRRFVIFSTTPRAEDWRDTELTKNYPFSQTSAEIVMMKMAGRGLREWSINTNDALWEIGAPPLPEQLRYIYR